MIDYDRISFLWSFKSSMTYVIHDINDSKGPTIELFSQYNLQI